MKINELILEDHQNLDEISLKGVGQAIGKGADVAGQAVGGAASGVVNTIKRFGQGLKKGWQGTSSAMAGDQADTDATDSTSAPQPTTSGSQPAGATGSAPVGGQSAPAASNFAAPGGTDELSQLKANIGKLNPQQKKELAGELEKSMNAPAAQPAAPAGTQPAAPAGGAAVDTSKMKADRDAKNAADAAERNKQIAATKQANAATAQADNELVAAVKAAKAKPGFQQTAQDKLTIQKGAAKGIHESKKKKKKVVAEFNSRFLGITI